MSLDYPIGPGKAYANKVMCRFTHTSKFLCCLYYEDCQLSESQPHHHYTNPRLAYFADTLKDTGASQYDVGFSAMFPFLFEVYCLRAGVSRGPRLLRNTRRCIRKASVPGRFTSWTASAMKLGSGSTLQNEKCLWRSWDSFMGRIAYHICVHVVHICGSVDIAYLHSLRIHIHTYVYIYLYIE